MSPIHHRPDLAFLSKLYARDAPDAVLLTEYPSSNSSETQFQNRSKYIIHDPFPPPTRALMKVLGPHHLMCGWGRGLAVTSELPPPPRLIEHWRSIFGDEGCPIWQPCPLVNDGLTPSELDEQSAYITLFPHESLSPQQQVIHPDTNYSLHSKEEIAKIDCPQAAVLEHVVPPCIVKLSHGYAGLGNFYISCPDDEAEMQRRLKQHWPAANLVINGVIENITGDFGVQFYLSKDGSMVWLGLTEQHFDANKKWCGGTFSASLQDTLFDELCSIVEPVGEHLHRRGYFGVVGIDVLRRAVEIDPSTVAEVARHGSSNPISGETDYGKPMPDARRRDSADQYFLVDVNPRLTGITPFLMAQRIFARQDGLSEGIYQASRRFPGSMEQLLETVEKSRHPRVVVFSAFEQTNEAREVTTVCHLSVSSDSQQRNEHFLNDLISIH